MNGVASARILYVLSPFGSLYVFLVWFSIYVCPFLSHTCPCFGIKTRSSPLFFIYVRCKKTEKVTREMKFFLDCFWTGLVFNCMWMVFLRAEAPGAEQPVEADTSVRERDEGDGMECPGKGRMGTRWHRGDVKKVRVWLQRCYCSPLRYRNSHVSSHTRQ